MLRTAELMLWFLTRLVLGLRYRVTVRGAERLAGIRGPLLVLPNHPAYIDPPLVLSHLGRYRRLRPLIHQGMYRVPVLNWLYRLIGGLEVREMGAQSRDAHRATLALMDDVAAGLASGQAFLIYPSGRLRRGEREALGGARSAFELLTRSPDAQVALVRTAGLWGSHFGCAWTGALPPLGRVVLWGAAQTLAAGVFFLPRRPVTIDVEPMPRERLPLGSREELNRWLEGWYNAGGAEPPTFVPYHPLWGPRTHDFAQSGAGAGFDPSTVPAATQQAVREAIEERLGRPLADDEAAPTTTLDALGLDSLERMDIALAIEDRFGFRSDAIAERIGDLWALADGRLKPRDGAALEAPPLWRGAASVAGPARVEGDTVVEAFVRRATRSSKDVATADLASGALTYRRLLTGARLLAARFAGLEGRFVGVVLPASVAADTSFFALHLAGKVPVLLNWTTGPANLEHAVRRLDVRCVVTSRRVVDRLHLELPGSVTPVYLEDARATIGRFERLAALLLAPWTRPTRHAPLPAPDDPAVVLFTSGSESAPKAAPLSHANVLCNCRAGIAALGLSRSDIMLGFLPPFHSFGMTFNLLLPLLAGMPVVHHADPKDARTLASLIAAYKPRITTTTPTFLSYVLNAAGPGGLDSLRLIVTGAEKCPLALQERVAREAPGAQVIEGYGITECSPAVSVNRPGDNVPGSLGAPLDGVDALVVHPETDAPLPAGEAGMLLVSGPSIFSGYLNHDGPSPFVERDGRRWYRTGDLVRRDEAGRLYFEGRLKRFLKAAGEMISLPALEGPLAERYPPNDAGPRVAVEGVETPEGRWIVLFTTFDIALREATRVLSEHGFRGVMRLDEVVRLEAIPVLGTGKTDYRTLRTLAQQRAERRGVPEGAG